MREPNEVIDDIELMRTHNNRSWMDLLRLAMELAPDRTRQILRDIADRDASVVRLVKELSR